MERVGLGRAKLLLFGEHAAVYGYPSVGLGLQASTEIRATLGPARGWRSPELSLEEGARFGELLAQAAALLPAIASEGGEIRIRSTVPRGLGFGSSAALCVALAQAFSDEGSPPAQVWSIAHRLERYFHGRPSGVDTGLSLFGGLRAFSLSAPPLPETRLLDGPPLHLLMGAVPRRDSTARLVGSLQERITSGEAGLELLVRSLGGAASQAMALIQDRTMDEEVRLGALGSLLEKAHLALGRLGLGDAGIDRLIRAGLERGASGGKQSGAGSGGAFFLLYRSKAEAQASAPALAEVARGEGIELAAPLWVVDYP